MTQPYREGVTLYGSTERHLKDHETLAIDLAAAALPDAVFLAADVTAVSLPVRHFGPVTAFNSVIHVPRERHAALYRDVHRWLRPGGCSC